MPSQIGMVMEKWKSLPGNHVAAAASPYASDDALVAAAQSLSGQGATALVLDCMGYTAAHKTTLQGQVPGLPVFVSAGVLASSLAVAF